MGPFAQDQLAIGRLAPQTTYTVHLVVQGEEGSITSSNTIVTTPSGPTEPPVTTPSETTEPPVTTPTRPTEPPFPGTVSHT